MKRKYRALVIGCGHIGVTYEADSTRKVPRSHAGALESHPRTELVALVDSDKKRLQETKRYFPRVHTYQVVSEALVKEKPDIVVIAASTESHVPLVREVCRAKVPMIICEKPLAASLREAKRVEGIVRASDSVFVLNYQRRFFRLFERVKRDIERGSIGDVQQVTCYYGNGLYNNGGHAIDSIMYLLGQSVRRVISAVEGESEAHPVGDINVDAILETKSGARVVLQSFDQNSYAIHELRLFGTTGAISIFESGSKVEWYDIRSSRARVLSKKRTVRSKESSVRGALLDVIRAFEDKSNPQSGLVNGMQVMAVLDGIERSARSGGRSVKIQ